MKQNVDASFAEFEEGVEAGVNSRQNSRDSQADHERELKDQAAHKGSVSESLVKEPPIPLFMRYTPGGNKGNAQDEKDEAAE